MKANEENLMKWEISKPFVDFWCGGYIAGGGEKVIANVIKEVMKHRFLTGTEP